MMPRKTEKAVFKGIAKGKVTNIVGYYIYLTISYYAKNRHSELIACKPQERCIEMRNYDYFINIGDVCSFEVVAYKSNIYATNMLISYNYKIN